MEDIFKGRRAQSRPRAVDALVRRGRSRRSSPEHRRLHEASGVPRDKIIELHGNTTYATCLDCGQRYEIADLRAAFERDGAVPPCDKCLGHVKNRDGLVRSRCRCWRCNARAGDAGGRSVHRLGSSLVVYPAAGFPQLPSTTGAALVIVNRSRPARPDRRSRACTPDRRHDGGAVGVK